jgi:8-amino-7-oxononanoate synthase
VSASLDRFLAEKLAAGGRSAWTRSPIVAQRASPGRAVIDGRERLLLCTNDYLGLAVDPRVVDAARQALDAFGAGSRAARSLAGDTELHQALERELADFKGVEAALLFGSGFSCNSSVIAALTRAGDVVVSDELNHASIVDGCRLSAAAARVYRHGDLVSLEAALRQSGSASKRMVVTDAVFSMDGDIAPLPGIVDLAERHDAFVMLDEAHATGVLGPGGAGSLEHFGIEGGVAVLMGTLGKALGSVGGFIGGSRDLIDFLAANARSFLFTTSLPPAAAAAALASLRILRAEPERVERLWRNARRLHAGLGELGFRVAAEPAAILPIFTGEGEASGLSAALYERDVVAQAVAAPYVPPGSERVRLIASAAHSSDDVEAILSAFAELAPGGRRPLDGPTAD